MNVSPNDPKGPWKLSDGTQSAGEGLDIESIIAPLLGAEWEARSKDLREDIRNLCTEDLQEHLKKSFDDLRLDWGYYPQCPVSHKIVSLITQSTLLHYTQFEGKTSVAELQKLAASSRPLLLTSNHLAYGDAILIKSFLDRETSANFPIVGLAGPKAYQTVFKRFMVSFFDSLLVPQPSARATEEAQVDVRQSLQIMKRIIPLLKEQLSKGKVLQFFPEGSRSRDGALQPFVPAASRFLVDNPLICPIGLIGTESLMGVNDDRIAVEKIILRSGPVLTYKELCTGLNDESMGVHLHKNIMDRLGYVTARLLPKEMQGVYRLSTSTPFNAGALEWAETISV
ncbi:MAG: 1-acyl-sn-glycerol-3-phosphate acyltransferase [Planctomycetes bacterium]|nr:1-acyl-sn-glycerol-3-phosphate acyltransferase [Planctomycetota bacterium]